MITEILSSSSSCSTRQDSASWAVPLVGLYKLRTSSEWAFSWARPRYEKIEDLMGHVLVMTATTSPRQRQSSSAPDHDLTSTMPAALEIHDQLIALTRPKAIAATSSTGAPHGQRRSSLAGRPLGTRLCF
jgi:hypothetical protein